MEINYYKLNKSCGKELAAILKKEAVFSQKAEKEPAQWKTVLSEKVPPKVSAALTAAFAKAFSLVFQKGTGALAKTCNTEAIRANYAVQDYSVKVKGTRRELKRMRKTAEHSQLVNTALTAAEGVGLGALGIGLPDILIFIGVLLRGAYECAMQYGHDCTLPEERYLILCMMEAALSRGEEWGEKNASVDRLLTRPHMPSDTEINEQIRKTAHAFAMDMLLLKFIQGLPIVGIIGGFSNPVYYNKIMGYVRLKYYKRYILTLQKQHG